MMDLSSKLAQIRIAYISVSNVRTRTRSDSTMHSLRCASYTCSVSTSAYSPHTHKRNILSIHIFIGHFLKQLPGATALIALNAFRYTTQYCCSTCIYGRRTHATHDNDNDDDDERRWKQPKPTCQRQQQWQWTNTFCLAAQGEEASGMGLPAIAIMITSITTEALSADQNIHAPQFFLCFYVIHVFAMLDDESHPFVLH